MSAELNFEALPFEAYDEFSALATEQSGFELEEERGGRARRLSASTPGTPSRLSQKIQSKSWSGAAKKKLGHRPQLQRPRWPRGLAYGAAPAPYSAEPQPGGSEYMRWVQSALNDVLGLQLPVNGVADPATRSAIRSFQQQNGLPADGVVGPDTERALIAARAGKAPQEGAAEPAGPAEPAPPVPAGELNFEWGSFELEPAGTRKVDEREAVRNRVAAGQRDPNALTDMIFFHRHPEHRRQPRHADEYNLVNEWKTILRNVVLPELAHGHARSASGKKPRAPQTPGGM
jgi:Putative peptidoglycan binding domain